MGDTRSIPSSEMIIEDLLENTDNKKNISKNTKNITTVFDEDIKDYDISKSEIQLLIKRSRWTVFCLQHSKCEI